MSKRLKKRPASELVLHALELLLSDLVWRGVLDLSSGGEERRALLDEIRERRAEMEADHGDG